MTKGTAGQIKPTQQSFNLLKAFKGGSELILIFHAEICLQNQAERWMRCSARGQQLISRRGSGYGAVPYVVYQPVQWGTLCLDFVLCLEIESYWDS